MLLILLRKFGMYSPCFPRKDSGAFRHIWDYGSHKYWNCFWNWRGSQIPIIFESCKSNKSTDSMCERKLFLQTFCANSVDLIATKVWHFSLRHPVTSSEFNACQWIKLEKMEEDMVLEFKNTCCNDLSKKKKEDKISNVFRVICF